VENASETIIKDKVLPIIQSGRGVLFLGAGFSCGTPTANNETIPSTPELIERILIAAGYSGVDTVSVDLETAFSVGADEIDNFEGFLQNNFICKNVFDWQKVPFFHWWRRIYTTNIDTVIEKCVEKVSETYKSGPNFLFYNYKDRLPATSSPLERPIVYLHGNVMKPKEGFVFDRVSYAEHTIKSGDWLYDAAHHLSFGDCIIVGSKLKESDLEAEIRRRTIWETTKSSEIINLPNYIVLKDFNEIEIKNYLKRGIIPIKSTAEEFFSYIDSKLKIISQSKYLKRIAPHLRIEVSDNKSFAWFNESFEHTPTACKKAEVANGILSRFFTGDMPDWFYIVNEVPSKFDYYESTLSEIHKFFGNDKPILSVFVTGPVASGKTTLCREILFEISKTVDAVYEFNSFDGIDIEYTWSCIKTLKAQWCFFLIIRLSTFMLLMIFIGAF